MAITYTQLTSDSGNTGYFTAPPYITASISPAANKLILLTVWTFATTASTPFFDPTSVTGNGLTWTLVAGQDHFPDDPNFPTTGMHSRVSVYRAVGSSPTTGAITIAYTGTQPDGCAWSVTQFTGADVTGTNGANAIVQAVTKQSAPTWPATALSMTLATLGNASNATFGAFAGPWDSATASAAIVMTPGSGYTKLSSGGAIWSYWMNEVKLPGSTTVNCTCSPSAQDLGGVAIEIKAATTDVTVGVTGNSSTGAVGTDAVSNAKAVTGNTSTAAVGTLAKTRTQGITGSTGTAAVGTLAASQAKALIGNSGTAAVGNAGSSIAHAVTGNTSMSAAGTLSAAVPTTAALSQVAATAAVGTMVATYSAALTLSGTDLTSSFGNVSVGQPIVLLLSGVMATGNVGRPIGASNRVECVLLGAILQMRSGSPLALTSSFGIIPPLQESTWQNSAGILTDGWGSIENPTSSSWVVQPPT